MVLPLREWLILGRKSHRKFHSLDKIRHFGNATPDNIKRSSVIDRSPHNQDAESAKAGGSSTSAKHGLVPILPFSETAAVGRTSARNCIRYWYPLSGGSVSSPSFSGCSVANSRETRPLLPMCPASSVPHSSFAHSHPCRNTLACPLTIAERQNWFSTFSCGAGTLPAIW
jgi:hypothetical protein